MDWKIVIFNRRSLNHWKLFFISNSSHLNTLFLFSIKAIPHPNNLRFPPLHQHTPWGTRVVGAHFVLTSVLLRIHMEVARVERRVHVDSTRREGKFGDHKKNGKHCTTRFAIEFPLVNKSCAHTDSYTRFSVSTHPQSPNFGKGSRQVL